MYIFIARLRELLKINFTMMQGEEAYNEFDKLPQPEQLRNGCGDLCEAIEEVSGCRGVPRVLGSGRFTSFTNTFDR